MFAMMPFQETSDSRAGNGGQAGDLLPDVAASPTVWPARFNVEKRAGTFRAYIGRYLPAFLLVGLIGLGLPACSGTKDKQAPEPVTVSTSSAKTEKQETEDNFAVSESPYVQGRSLLQDYYGNKYGAKERNAVTKGVKELLPNYDAEQAKEAIDTILGYHYVVYHVTTRHDLTNNHAVARQVESQLRTICVTLNVPFEAMLAVVSWENSGDTSKVSYANAAGLGQMTPGAVEMAHHYGARKAKEWRLEAARLRTSGLRDDKTRAERLERAAKMADAEKRHLDAVEKNKVSDERLIVACNLEDTVLFFKYLLERYSGRVDLAISAYHNGFANNDDIIYSYLRHEKKLDISAELDPSRMSLKDALELYDIKYIDLWNSRFTREILCGLRTVYGEKVNDENASLAMGDESDLYPWKVIASYVGFSSGEGFVRSMQERYSGGLDLCEVRGLPAYESQADLTKAMEGGFLCALDPTQYKNFGVDSAPAEKVSVSVSQAKAADKANADGKAIKEKPTVIVPKVDPEVKKMCWYCSPELCGYLSQLRKRFAAACGNPRVKVPLNSVFGAWALGKDKDRHVCAAGSASTHYRGVAADIALHKLPADQHQVLERLILEDFLLDVVYIRRTPDGDIHVVLNPRCGDEFVDYYVANVSPSGKIARARDELRSQQKEKERAKALEEAARERSDPQYGNRAKRARQHRQDMETERLNKELSARKAAESRAAAVKKREAQGGLSEKTGTENERKATADPGYNPEEKELLAIPDDVDNFGDDAGTRGHGAGGRRVGDDSYDF